MELEKISYTALRDYLKCPKLFLFRKILELPLETKQIELHFGSSIHKALELFHTKKLDPIITFQKEFTKDKLNKDEYAQWQDYIYMGNNFMKYYVNYQDTLLKVYNTNIIANERFFSLSGVKDPITGETCKIKRITGVVDYVTEDGKLGDFKTSKNKYTQEDIDTSLQPDFYYLWYYMTYHKLPTAFQYIVFVKSNKRDLIQVLETTRNLDDISRLIQTINIAFDNISQNKFEKGCNDNEYCDCKLYDAIFK